MNTYTIETPIEEHWSKLQNKLLDTMNTYVQSKIKSSSIRQPWINYTGINNKVTTKLIYQHICYIISNSKKNAVNHTMSVCQIAYKSPIKMAKRKFLANFCGVDTLQKDGILYSDDQDKANVLIINHYFSTVFTKSDNFVLPNMGLSPYPDINRIEITIAGVKKLLLGLDPSKSPGSDKIPRKLLKVMASEIAPYLSLVFTASLHQGTVPQD